jgi:hypothetical protein
MLIRTRDRHCPGRNRGRVEKVADFRHFSIAVAGGGMCVAGGSVAEGGGADAVSALFPGRHDFTRISVEDSFVPLHCSHRPLTDS